MLRSTRSSVLGRRLRAAGGLAVAMSLAACGDAATAPQPSTIARVIERPSEFVGQIAAYVTVRMVDTTGATLNEPGWIHFSTSTNDTMSVLDNTAKDLDPAAGVIKAALKKSGNYTACFVRSQHYFPDYGAALQKWPKCRTVSSGAFNVDMGKVYGQRMPMVTLITKNQFGTLIGGADFDFLTPWNGWHLTFTDGDVHYDESPGANGVVKYALGWPGTYQICEVDAPPKSILTSTACYTINAKWGQTYVFTFYHETQIF